MPSSQCHRALVVAALATVVGVLVEISVMLSVCSDRKYVWGVGLDQVAVESHAQQAGNLLGDSSFDPPDRASHPRTTHRGADMDWLGLVGITSFFLKRHDGMAAHGQGKSSKGHSCVAIAFQHEVESTPGPHVEQRVIPLTGKPFFGFQCEPTPELDQRGNMDVTIAEKRDRV